MDDTPNTFHQLRPVCVSITKNPTVRNLQHALKEINKNITLKNVSDSALLEYLMFPFKLTLQKRKTLREEQEILCFKCLHILYENSSSTILKIELLWWTLNMFSMYFVTVGVTGTKQELSEELKYVIVQLLGKLFCNVTEDNLQLIYEDKHLPLVGHVTSILLNLVENERDQKLQIAALDSLKLVCGDSLTSPMYKQTCGDFLSSFLPGTAMMFNRFLTSAKNQSYRVIVSALSTISHIVCITMNDDLNACNRNPQTLQSVLDTFHHQEISHDIVEDDEKCLKIRRTAEWTQKTAKNLAIIFENILPVLMCHNHVKARLAVVDFVTNMLTHCMQTLSSSVPDFLDVLVKLTCDSYEDVKFQSKKSLDLATKNFQSKDNNTLKSLLDEKLYSQFLSLPRIMNSANEDVKLAKVQILKGYLQFYGDVLTNVLYSHTHLEKFITALLQVLELDHSNINIVEEKTDASKQAISFNEEAVIINKFTSKHFKLLTDMQVLTIIRDIIRLLALHGDVQLLFDFLLEKCHQSSMHRAPTILIMNELLLSCMDVDSDNLTSIIKMLISTYLDDSLWKLPVTNKHLSFSKNSSNSLTDLTLLTSLNDSMKTQSYSTIPFETLHNNIQIVCLLLEGISISAQVLKTNFNILLIHTLYPVLEKVGSVNAAISRTAMHTLNDIIKYCSYESIPDLILLNADYLINSITMQFRHLVHGSAAPAVLCVVLRFCSKELMVIVADAIEDVFRMLDEYQEEVAEDMLNVLKHFAVAVGKWYQDNDASSNKIFASVLENPKEEDITNIHNNSVSISDFFDEYCKLSLHAAGSVGEDDVLKENIESHGNGDNMDEESDYFTEQQKKVTPLHYQVVIQSLEKCTSFVAATNDNIKLKALDVVLSGINALGARENDLLPILHTLWPAVIRRMKDTNQVIIVKSLDVINTMVKYSGDFLRKRMTTEFLPTAIQFLNANSKTFTKDQSKFTLLHRVQEKLLCYLGEIVPTLDVSKEEFCRTATVCAKYINCRLHESIQKVAYSTLQQFYNYKPAVVWIMLQSIQNTEDLTPPHPSFKHIIIPKSAHSRNEYTDKIVEFISSSKNISS